MSANFKTPDREQMYLIPPSLKDWIKKAHEKLEEQDRTKPEDQVNMTDSESRIMRKNNRSEYSQSYNAQAVVDAEGSQMVVGARVTNVGTDWKELVANIESIPKELGEPEKVLADNGYVREEQVKQIQEKDSEVFLPVMTAYNVKRLASILK